MRRFLVAISALCGGILMCVAITADAQDETPTSPGAGQANRQSTDMPEIRQAAADFVSAFNRGDADAVAGHWTDDGVYIDEDGQQFLGRKSIQQEYETLFKRLPQVRLSLEIDSVRLVNADTAIEEGRAALSPQPPGAVRVMSSYTAVHVKQDGKWLMADVRDRRVELPPDAGQLEDLEWLVGTWSAANQETRLEVKCRWVENQHFLARSHAVTESGTATSGGLELIGLDPSTGRITSWSFANDGGFAVGIWAPHENGWAVDSVGVHKDGTQTTATNILSRQDSDTLLWKSVNRSLGETLLPDTDKVALKRK